MQAPSSVFMALQQEDVVGDVDGGGAHRGSDETLLVYLILVYHIAFVVGEQEGVGILSPGVLYEDIIGLEGIGDEGDDAINMLYEGHIPDSKSDLWR